MVQSATQSSAQFEMPTGLAMCPLVEPHELHGFIVAIIRRVENLNLAHYEEPRQDVAECLTTVRVILTVAIETLGLVVSYYEAEAEMKPESETVAHDRKVPSGQGKFLREVDRRMEHLKGAGDIADLAYMARMGLRGREVNIAGLPKSADRWQALGEGNGACREVLKSFSALESAICTQQGLSSENTYYETELMRSLETRQAYAAFRREVCKDEPASEEETKKRLRLSAIAIAKLVGRDVYPFLRVRDRIQIRAIQTRIMTWLRTSTTGSVRARPGIRLWQDLSSFADLLIQVNNRAELKLHDATVTQHALVRLDGLLPRQNLWLSQIFDEPTSLRGRDVELDELIAVNGAIDTEATRLILTRIVSQFTSESLQVDAPKGTANPESNLGEDFL